MARHSTMPITPENIDTVRDLMRARAARGSRPAADTADAEVRSVLATPSAIGRLIAIGGVPVGHVFAIDALAWRSRLPAGVPVGAYEIGLQTNLENSGRAIVEAAVLQEIAEEVFATTLAPACCTFPAASDEIAVRAHEHAGFRWLAVIAAERPARRWCMLLKRPST